MDKFNKKRNIMAFVAPDYSNLNFDEMATAIGLKPKHIPILIMSFTEESKTILEKLKIAIAEKNYSDIQHHAHSIKGSAGNLKFNELYEMAKEMEFAGKDSNATFAYDEAFSAMEAGINTIAM